MSQSAQEANVESIAAPKVQAAFDRLEAAYRRDPVPSLRARLESLRKLKQLTKDNAEAISEAIRQDFGHRSRHDTALAEIFPIVQLVTYIEKNLKGWMKPERRPMPATFLPASAKIIRQPLGVVGIVSPWNYPYNLTAGPLAYALAAGNRVFIKPSELTPRTSALMNALFTEAFGPDLVAVVEGGPEVAAAFTRLPFDHLIFTGSTNVGRHVMRAAAENLTPVTLELGGKSPVIVHESFPVEKAANRIVFGKLINAGQTCIAPDYVLVHESKRDALVDAIASEIPQRFPSLAANPDYTAIVNDRHRERVLSLVRDAEQKGARKIEINPAAESFDNGAGKMAPVLLLDVRDDMKVMQEEIFGPVLPIVTYRTLDEAIEYVNARPRPLALYYFDYDASRADEVLERTVSGGAVVNDTLLQFAAETLPFGGVGPSGLGAYHGPEGFDTFSHKKAVVKQAKLNAAGLLSPPYGERIDKLLKLLMR
ncbi:MAG: coniferyl aldehyde dehydrogenase [Myxococcales bacterium]|jgi:coniferyl-aldehyde dehydrogenase|nr:coniferyl aldehyde dehydrogenase [Myxococcales bacterium]